MNKNSTLYIWAGLFFIMISLVQTSWSAQDEKSKPVTGNKVANLRAAFENNQNNASKPTVKSLPIAPQNKPIPKSPLPNILPKPIELFEASNPHGFQQTLSYDWLIKIFNAPFIETNTKATASKSTGEVAAKIDGPNGTKISHKLSFTPYLRIKGLIKPSVIACMKDYDVAGHSTLGPDYEDILVTYNLYENNILIENSKFEIMVSTKKNTNRK